MDSVRFGRALGIGARSAAKALAGAMDAATAPNPTRPASRPPTTTPAPRPSAYAPSAEPIASAAKSAGRATVRTQATVRDTRKGIARGSKRFGEAVWGPFAKLSRVLWLEITGSFFGIFALFAAHAVWANRDAFHFAAATHDARTHLIVFLVMALAFGYFCISSFVRAYRR